MKICAKCNTPISTSDVVKIISGPTVIDEDGIFLISKSFVQDAVLYHEECIKTFYNNPRDILLRQILKLDKLATPEEVAVFLDKPENIEKDNKEIILNWFDKY